MLLLIPLLFLSCTSDNSVEIIPVFNNLLLNSTFEENGQPSFQRWNTYNADSSSVIFVRTAPTHGGTYSIGLKNQWTIPGRISYSISGITGTHIYKFSIWERGFSELGFSTPGQMALSVLHGDIHTYGNSLSFSDSVWANKILLDTLTTSASDTILVSIGGSWSQWATGYHLIDLCRLEIIE